MLKFYASISVLIVLALSEKVVFNNYTLYKVLPRDNNDIKFLQDLKSGDVKYDFWSDIRHNADYVNIMTSPDTKTKLEGSLDFHHIPFKITINNVQEAIDNQTIKAYTPKSRNMTWDAFYTLEDIEAWMSDMVNAHPSATEIEGGISFEGRKIKGLKISHGPAEKVIVIEAGIHAREWIAMSTACFVINELLTSNDEEAVAARESDWYIFPVLNPDGYVWSHQEFRFWKKNRRPIGTAAFGVDLNRNFNNSWMASGGSTDPLTDTYAGEGSFSEPETKSFSEYLQTIKNIEMHLSFRSYGQVLTVPNGNTTELSKNYNDTIKIGRKAMGALSVRHHTQYDSGHASVNQSSGRSIDWVKANLSVPLVYAYELRDRGDYGFLLPANQILPNNEEAFDSILELIHQGKRLGYFNVTKKIEEKSNKSTKTKVLKCNKANSSNVWTASYLLLLSYLLVINLVL